MRSSKLSRLIVFSLFSFSLFAKNIQECEFNFQDQYQKSSSFMYKHIDVLNDPMIIYFAPLVNDDIISSIKTQCPGLIISTNQENMYKIKNLLNKEIKEKMIIIIKNFSSLNYSDSKPNFIIINNYN